METSNHPIVVGIDGSASSGSAARWAAREATLRGIPLRVVHAFTWPHEYHVGKASVGTSTYRAMHRRAEAVLRQSQADIETEFPTLAIEPLLVEQGPVQALTEQTRSAALVVVGSHGKGGVDSSVLGSVAIGLTQHACCPVIVVRGDSTSAAANRPVIVGIDGSPAGEPALEFAFTAAAGGRVPLLVAHAVEDTSDSSGRLHLLPSRRDMRAEAEAMVTEMLGPWCEKFPDVPVEQEVRMGRPADLLLEQGAAAQLIVVGSRGRGTVKGLLLGSTSQHVLHHAPCPVAVVRPLSP